MNLVITFIIVSVCFCVTAKHRQDGSDEAGINLINYYSAEDDHPDSTHFITLRGKLRKKFALTAATDRPLQNMICSPVSALLPLGKLALGAKHVTIDELLMAIGVSRSRKLKPHFAKLIEHLKYLRGVQLHVATRIYLSKDLSLHKSFLKHSQYIFDSTAEKIDFSNPVEAASIINTWVAKKTNGMVQDLLSPRALSKSPSLVLVNAIYFAGQWKYTFDKLKDGMFYTPNGPKQVTMMTKNTWYNYANSRILGAQLIEVPYEGDEASFVIVLPNNRKGLPALLSQLKLAPELLNSELRKMSKLKVELTMPKFKVETELDLKDLYKKVGVHNIFEMHNSGLKKIVHGQYVYVSNAVQKSVIEVTELGTEAAAVSEVQVIGISYDVHREKINCDHPFLFFVVTHREQLFAGVLNNL